MNDFNQFGLAEPLTYALAGLNYTTPTPIQSQAIPLGMEGRDVLGIAQTGTGKTAAFALPILNAQALQPHAAPRHSTRALVLAPTRELASQIADSFRALGRHMKLHVGVMVGGVPINRQIKAAAQGFDVLVATPGRLLDLVDQRALSLSHVEVLVLDEADQMLDLGFIHALKRIAGMVPARRQTMLFSATMPDSIADIAKRFLKDPARVAVTPVASTAERIEQWALHVNAAEKQALLTIHLRDKAVERALVFTRTKHGADRVVRKLNAAGIQSAAIHGNKSQPAREKALLGFRQGTCRVLVATDIAARGIDVSGVSHVFNFDIPNVAEQYVHRIGRTARAGKTGMAVSYVAHDERAYIRDIEKLTKQTIRVAALPPGLTAEVAAVRALGDGEPERDEREDRFGRGGGRPQRRSEGAYGQRNGADRGGVARSGPAKPRWPDLTKPRDDAAPARRAEGPRPARTEGNFRTDALRPARTDAPRPARTEGNFRTDGPRPPRPQGDRPRPAGGPRPAGAPGRPARAGGPPRGPGGDRGPRGHARG